MSSTGTPPPVRLGRPPSSSRGEIEHVAISLFEEKGFDETTVDEIATAAGIGRRTFFRYYPSKNDVPWGDFGTGLASMRADLAAQPADRDVLEALQGAVLAFNDFDPGETVWHRRRMRLLLEVPALTAHSALKYAAWREVVAEFAAARCGVSADSLLPRTLGYAALGAAISAYETWLDDEGSDLQELLTRAFTEVRTGFAGLVGTRGAP